MIFMPPVIIKQNGATQLQSNKYRRNIEQDGKGANFRTWTRQPPRCWLYISVFQYQSEAVSSYNNLQSFSYIISHVLQSSNLLNATCDFIKIFQQRQRYKVKYFSHYYEKNNCAVVMHPSNAHIIQLIPNTLSTQKYLTQLG
ncbi:Hypothetical_protein [Hexamita inflata]|uniref:Hypothetical_protein n=1 Tax=Hexamita inflata TaxID=28002 RepID=A0AA86NEC5_9EUKA|nr:Hypothetical protein HINF_LOCUS5181 [Hexamita inflata]